MTNPEDEEKGLRGILPSRGENMVKNVVYSFCSRLRMFIAEGFQRKHLSPGNYSTFEDAHERDQQHRAELAQRQHDKQEKMEKQVKEME